MELILSTKPITPFVSAGSEADSTRDLNFDLHFGHSKPPTMNCGFASSSPCFLKDTGQLLTAAVTSVPQLGHSTKPRNLHKPDRVNELRLKRYFANSDTTRESDAYLEHQPFNEFLVAVADGNLGHLRDLSNLTLRLPPTRQH